MWIPIGTWIALGLGMGWELSTLHGIGPGLSENILIGRFDLI